MIIELKNYQEKYIDKLKSETDDLLNQDGGKVCIFKAPTGSGKTIMMAEFLRRLVSYRDDGKRFSFIWLSVRDLHNQSKKSLKKYYQHNNAFICSDYGNLDDRRIRQDEILFLNWESINKKDNIYVRENERNNNLSTVIANTKDEGREIILIIDESHHTAISEKSTKIINDIAPKITIEVSATPTIKIQNAFVEVPFEEVRKEGMIKSEISINPGFQSVKVTGKSSREVVLDAAIEKRKQLKKCYEVEGSDINPLLLIQLPNLKKGINDLDKDVLTFVKKYLKAKHDITEDNGKMAVWLAEEKSPNLVNIEKGANETEILIFKQAIALGWDCPRASVLVIFRETKEKVFLLQTVGRIMRMPEFHHYENKTELNKGFVFTNLADIEIVGDIAKEYLTIYENKRNEEVYKLVNLKSVHFKRQREKTRLSGQFNKIFMEIASQMDLKNKIKLKVNKLKNEIMVDGRIVNLDDAKMIDHGIRVIPTTEMEIQTRYDYFIMQNCSPFAPMDSSGIIKTALNKFFTTHFKFDNYDMEIQKVILSEDNIQIMIEAIEKTKEQYIKTVVEKEQEREIEIDDKWNVPEIINYSSKYIEKNYKKSVMQPYYSLTRGEGSQTLFEEDSDVEVEFIKYLEKAKQVKWWYKNGDSEVKYFAVEYTDKYGKKAPFYVDFIIQMNNGQIGLFDTKKGRTAEDAKERAEGLAKYIKEQNKKGKKLFGGIVIYKNNSWRYNNNDKYSYNPKDLSEWKFLDLDK